MIGSNRLLLNTASMIAALQMWLDDQFESGKAPRVENVQISDATQGTFRVDLSDGKGAPTPVEHG